MAEKMKPGPKPKVEDNRTPLEKAITASGYPVGDIWFTVPCGKGILVKIKGGKAFLWEGE